jgi:ribosome-binding ATPase YchF (GTP1/OBG family)
MHTARTAKVERRLQKASKDKKTDPAELSSLKKLQEALDAGTPARLVELTDDERKQVQGLGLLSAKKASTRALSHSLRARQCADVTSAAHKAARLHRHARRSYYERPI